MKNQSAMWSLRKSSEISEIICIPVGEPFTIGRIESSLNLTDDKSVSRRHASISNINTSPILQDCNSKFGTFVNGVRLEPGASFPLQSGHTIKFGGAGSEYLFECKPLSIFYKPQRRKELGWIEGAVQRFGGEVVGDVRDAGYFVLDEGEFDETVAAALLLGKCIVSPDYFRQLLTPSNSDGPVTFSLGLIQPSLPKYPTDCWLPRRDRLNAFKKAFEDITRFVFEEKLKEEEKRIITIIAEVLQIKCKLVACFPTLKFNELLVIPNDDSMNRLDKSDLTTPIRTISFQSICDGLLRSDISLFAIETVYPTVVGKRNVDIVGGINDDDVRIDEVKESKYVSAHVNSQSRVESQSHVNSQSLEMRSVVPDYTTGPSKTAVIPIPLSFLRLPPPSIDPSTSTVPTTRKPKFVKCHPRHRQPGTIPALIGPDQLTPTSTLNTISKSDNTSGGNKRRMLVKDSWLAEDDFKEEVEDEEEGGVKVVSVNVKIKENLNVNSANSVNKIQNVSSLNIAKPPTTTPTDTSTTTSKSNPTVSATATSSKFQSSFFKNLSKGK